jgi:hypothetical protein
VSLDNSCVLLQWLCTTGSDCVSLDNSCVLLVGCVPLDSSCVLLWKDTSLAKREC